MKNWEDMDGFEKRETCPEYWNDSRWEEVERLRERKKHAEANSLVMKIRVDWGME